MRNAESALNCSWQCLGTWGTWGDLGDAPPAQGGLEVRAWERVSGSVWISLGQRGCLFANSGSNGAVLKNIPLPGVSHGPKHAPCRPAPRTCPCHGSSGGCAAPCQHDGYGWASAAARLRPLPLSSPPSQARAAAITCHMALCLERRERVCCLLWKAFTLPFVIADHTQRTTFVSFSLIPTQTFLPGLIPILLAANAGTLSFLLCSLLSHGYPSKINYLQQTLSLQHCSI